jgi:D-glycero-D-manno-heptose 1,7-bisphosphate phosphatase
VSTPAVFLDRDGVIVELVWDAVDGSFEGPVDENDVRLVRDAADAIRRIRSLDYRVVVVSNQPGVAKGKASRDELRATHERVVRLRADQGAAVDDYRYCLHHPDAVDARLRADCGCRKPHPGMLLAAAADLGIDLSSSWMIGDSDVDAEAGREAGCRTILVENPQSMHRRRGDGPADFRVRDLARSVDVLSGEDG